MRLLALALALAGAASATTTTLTRTVTVPTWPQTSGTVYITLSAECEEAGVLVMPSTQAVNFTGGSFSVAVVPNDTCYLPGTSTPANTSYSVVWAVGTARTFETWYVPTSGTPLSVDSVIISGPTTPASPFINLPSLSPAGASTGNTICFANGVWGPGTCGSGGAGVWGSITGTLSNQTDLASALSGKEPAITAGTTAQYWRGDKTWQSLNSAVQAALSATSPVTINAGVIACPSCLTSAPVTSVFGRAGAVVAASGDYTTSLVTESGNLYFTNARAIAATLTGYTSGAGTISASDSILGAIQKLNGNIGALVTGVSTVFGRSGAVVAASGDYSFSQISGSLAISQINASGTASSGTYLRGDGTWTAAPVTSFIGRTGAVTAQTGDYSYSQISGTPTLYYQTVQANGTNQTQRTYLNHSSDFTVTDSSSNNSSTIALAATISPSISGNAATATAAKAAGTECSSGQYARGVDTSWNAIGCTAASSGGNPTQTTVSGLVATAGNLYYVTDGTTICDTTTGGGSNGFLTYYNGSKWVCFGRMGVIGSRPTAGGSSTITASTTQYCMLTGAFGCNGTESNVIFKVPIAIVVTGIHITTIASQPSTGSLVCTFRSGGSNSNLTFTIAASGAAGDFSDTTTSHWTAVAANTSMSLGCVNNATGSSAGISQIDMEFISQ
jgi:hypothetical protein